MKTVIKWTLWERRLSSVMWVIGIVAFIILNLAFYPSFRDQREELEKTFSQIPDAAMALFSDTGDFLSPEGFLSSQVFYLMLPLLLGILAISLGSSLLAREENSGTVELLLSRPLSRTKLLLGKALSGVLILVLAGMAATTATVIVSRIVELDIAAGRILMAGALAIVLSLIFGAIAFTITAIGGPARSASIGIAALIAFGGYIVVSLNDVASWLSWPAKLFPYHYYRPGEVLTGASAWGELAGLFGVVLALGIISVLAFRRRDITG